MSPADLLKAALSRGEWTNIAVVSNDVGGMMSKRQWAVLARAHWLRGGGKDVFVKYIIPAPDSAGETTLLATERVRLKKLCERLVRIQGYQFIPLVPLVAVHIVDATGGLLIAMEPVTTLHDVIRSGTADHAMAAAVLRDLGPNEREGVSWCHFDVCPKNIGMRDNGSFVFIDVESIYLAEGDHYVVSLPAWKRPRAPKALVDLVDDQVGDARLTAAAGKDKQALEVAICAAECVLGPLPTKRGALSPDDILQWSLVRADAIADFFRREIASAWRAGRLVHSLQEIQVSLRELIAESTGGDDASTLRAAVPDAGVTLALVAPPSSSTPTPMSTAAVPQAAEPVETRADANFVDAWSALGDDAKALRGERLSGSKLYEYRRRLEKLRQRFPENRDVVGELILIAISYEKDPLAARAILQDALRTHADDREFLRLKRVVDAWAERVT